MDDETRVLGGRMVLVGAPDRPAVVGEADTGDRVWFVSDLEALEARLTSR